MTAEVVPKKGRSVLILHWWSIGKSTEIELNEIDVCRLFFWRLCGGIGLSWIVSMAFRLFSWRFQKVFAWRAWRAWRLLFHIPV